MIPFLLSIGVSLGIFANHAKVGTAAWCTVNKTDGTVQCNYKTKDDCETYRESDEQCIANSEPGKKY